MRNLDALTLLIKSGIDIIALTETWLNPAADLPPLLSDACSNYTVIRCDRDSARGGGVAMLDSQLSRPRGPIQTFCQNYGLAQLVRDCTRGGHLLDLVMSNDVSLISDVEVKSPLGFSDHYSLHFKVNVCAPTRSTKLMHKREHVWKRAKLSDTIEDWESFKSINKSFESKLRKYNASIEKRIVSSGCKSGFYKLLKFRLKRKPKLQALRAPNGELIIDDTERAEVLASAFETHFGESSAHVDLTVAREEFPQMEDSAWFRRDDILETLLKWPRSESVTPDFIPLSFIKKYIFNLSFMNSEVPSRWIQSLITPIPKKPPYTEAMNFRPISITSVFAPAVRENLEKTNRGPPPQIFGHLSLASMGFRGGSQR
ncbi:hypothetical protein COOONC_18174 [Cooperia oncophora]